AAVGAAIHLLPEIADAVAEPLGKAIGQVHAEQPQIARGPLEKVLIVALEEIPAATEVLPLGRPDLDDVFAIGDRRLSRELDYAAIRQFETVVGIEGGIVAERFDEIPRPDVPPTAQRRVAVEVQLLVLQVAAVDERSEGRRVGKEWRCRGWVG